jgi:hypothetical protein
LSSNDEFGISASWLCSFSPELFEGGFLLYILNTY